MAVGVRHQFIGLLGSRIQADRMRNAVFFGKRDFAVQPIHAAGTGIYQVLDSIVPATFQDIQEAVHIAFHIGIRIFYGVAHTGLGRQIHHPVQMFVGKQHTDSLLVLQVHPHETE